MTNNEILSAAREIVAAGETGDCQTIDNRSWKYGLHIARELLRLAAELAEARAEVGRLNTMRVHCQDCGGDYLQTGVETGCACKLKAELAEAKAALAESRAALEPSGPRVVQCGT